MQPSTRREQTNDDLNWAVYSRCISPMEDAISREGFFSSAMLHMAVLGFHRLEGMCEFSVQWQGLFSVCEKRKVESAANKIWGS